jgi:hypothetical protein
VFEGVLNSIKVDITDICVIFYSSIFDNFTTWLTLKIAWKHYVGKQKWMK